MLSFLLSCEWRMFPFKQCVCVCLSIYTLIYVCMYIYVYSFILCIATVLPRCFKCFCLNVLKQSCCGQGREINFCPINCFISLKACYGDTLFWACQRNVKCQCGGVFGVEYSAETFNAAVSSVKKRSLDS